MTTQTNMSGIFWSNKLLLGGILIACNYVNQSLCFVSSVDYNIFLFRFEPNSSDFSLASGCSVFDKFMLRL